MQRPAANFAYIQRHSSVVSQLAHRDLSGAELMGLAQTDLHARAREQRVRATDLFFGRRARAEPTLPVR